MDSGVFDSDLNKDYSLDDGKKTQNTSENSNGTELGEKNAVDDDSVDKSYEAAKKASNGSFSMGGDKKEDEEVRYTDEELELAEQLIFSGAAEKIYTHDRFKGFSVTLGTLRANDYDMIDTIIMDDLEKSNTGDNPTISDNTLTHRRDLYRLALTVKKINSEEIVKGPNTFKVLKSGITKYFSLMSEGDLEKTEKLLDIIKSSVRLRADKIREKPSSIVDWLITKHSEFENKMYEIINRSDDILGK